MNLFWLSHRTVVYPTLHWPPFPDSGKRIFLSLKCPDRFLCHSPFSQCLTALILRRQSSWSVMLITNLRVILKSRISGAIPAHPLWRHGLHRDKFMLFTALNVVIYNRAAVCFMWFRKWNFVCNLFEIYTSKIQWSFECGCWMSKENVGTGFNRGCWKASERRLIEAAGRHRHIYRRQDMFSDFPRITGGPHLKGVDRRATCWRNSTYAHWPVSGDLVISRK
jgi:hypothetical protein